MIVIRAITVGVSLVLLAWSIQAQTSSQISDTANILMSVYQATGGKNWRNSTNWSSSNAKNVCRWAGIQCWSDSNSNTAIRGQVRSVTLSNNKLVGTIPSDLWKIPFLQSLDIRDNPDVDLDLTNVANANFLEYMFLSNSGITDLSLIGNAQYIVYLYLTECYLTGRIPSGIFKLTYLQGLYANFNNFDSTIPTTIGQLTNLQELYLYNTALTGTIPTQIGLLTNLQVLALSDNYMTGTIPSEIRNLSNLRVLALQKDPSGHYGSTFSGRIPSFATFTSLSELYLSYNALTGSLPSSFLRNAAIDQIITVDLSYNQIEGTITSNLSRLNYLNIYLVGNKITNIDDSICTSNADWMNGAVQDLGCEAILCDVGTCAPLGRATSESDSNKCKLCNYPNFMGGTPQLVEMTQEEILLKFYSDTNGPSWYVESGEKNWDPDDYVCSWLGITCDNDDNVIGIDLENRTLTGYPGSGIFSLPNLNYLNLGNNLIQFDFDGISRATNLETLYLHSCGLTELKNFNQLADVPLKELALNSNSLTRTIPGVIYSIITLENVWLSYNNFFGTLSTNIGLLSNLKKFYAYDNDLTGTIPSQIGLLQSSLQELVLSENDLTGTLPSTLNDMWELTLISIHQTTNTRGGISGPLINFNNCNSLTSIHLNHNSLTGRIPPGFLRYSDHKSDVIDIDLSNNQLTGTLPSTWSILNNLLIDLTGNKITSIAPQLCDMTDWQDGEVEKANSCDAILCPIGTYNDYGRWTSDQECLPCAAAQYMGTNICGQRNNQRSSLFKLFFSLDGWKRISKWGSATNECSWRGITCDSSGNVVAIDLSNQGLYGNPSNAVFNLPLLSSLTMSQNEVKMDFHGIENATNLKTLDLSDCLVDSLTGVGKSLSLRSLHLTSNKLAGTIPLELFQITQLQYLYLSYNSLTGRLPSQIGQLTNLQEIFLLQNSLRGQIPATIGRLTKLQYLILAENLFSGTLPEALNLLTNLLVASLGRRLENRNNAITGPLLSFRSLRYLNTLYLDNNMLTGTIPTDFLDGVANKTGAIDVNLESNRLQGGIPSSLKNFEALNIILSGNMLTDLPPVLCSQKRWMNALVGSLSCDAILCPPGKVSLYGYAYSDSNQCKSCPSTQLSPFYGGYECKTPDQVAADEEINIMIDFFRATNGNNWDSNLGWLDFSRSTCDWAGISCSSDGRVEGINLPYLNLEGNIPSSFFKLEKLKYINFSGNYINMDLTKAASLKSLTRLNLDDTGLSSIAGLKSTNVTSIHIAFNQFSTFPSEIFSLTKLQVLSMSNNPIAGTIPEALSKLTSLLYFSCNSCGFRGTIPSFLGFNLLTYLSLANNQLTGEFPSVLASLPSLQYVDISSQTPSGGISGKIPKFKSSTLSQIFLSKNLLSGSIPSDFLSSNTTGTLKIDLRSNRIWGSIPATLQYFRDVEILLSDNQISVIDPRLCLSNSTWNGGDVARFNCSGILCPPTTFNALGRQTLGFYGDCIPCPDLQTSKIYGSTYCGSLQTPEHILTKFYLDLNGDNWKVNDNWLESPSVCLWFGIGCDSNGAVVSISLETNGLIGNVPLELYNLTTLTSISLKGNEIYFIFNGIDKLSSLETLILSSIGLTDISGLGKAVSLKNLILTSNSLVSLPNEIYGLTNLQSLMLNYNGLAGSLPSLLGKLTKLQGLYLYHNKIVGSLPSQIGYLSNLTILSLGENFLSGPIPNEINYLKKLEKLSIDRQGLVEFNSLSRVLGSYSVGFTGYLPSLHLSPNLREIYMGHCNFTGTIPNNFLAGKDDYESLITVDLSGNQITGTMPSVLKRFGNLDLNIAGNQISEIDESFCYQGGWMNGLVGLYGCDAFACPKGSYNAYGRQISDAEMCIPCPYTSSSTLNFGSITCIPDGKVYTEKEILKLVYNSTGGTSWKTRTHWMDERVSICEWFGVKCNAQDKVSEVNLPSNNLVGTVTPYIFGLKFMRALRLSDNKIDLPLNGIGYAISLEEINIDRTSISSLRGINQAQNLRVFQSQSNNFYSTRLPIGLFDLPMLEILQVSDCHFGGSLPTQIGKLTNLKEFWCHDNDLIGAIPSQIGLLQNLKILSLSENKLVGTLPKEIGFLQSLESIFIDHFTRPGAGLSGPLPSFSNAPSLSEIYLNANTITGRIPIDFLSGIANTSNKITVGLRSNRIEGTVPGELVRFEQLNIDLADNWISGIHTRLCSKSKWMDGLVGSFGCDAILCPTATANRYGRRTTNSSTCKTCSETDSGDAFFGTVQCLTDVKTRERAILTNFYNSCGGKKWFKSNNWLNKNIDICDWYGISCKPGGSIQAILLGSNNLSGSPPRELFNLINLQWLWLYSNPIDFNFAGIENALRLQSLLLGSTGLKSLKGIKGAFGLKEVDIRFNALSGPFPTELLQLVNLESLLMSSNSLTGSIPELTALSNLKILQLGSNLFSGKLRSFAKMGSLITIDLSGNKLSGTIPRNILFSVPTDSKILVDLSNNFIEGTLPEELGRFNYASIYLQDNFISGISSNLCTMTSWNDGDVGSYECSGILCPSQTFAVGSGRAGKNNTECLLCGMAKYYGQTKCVDLMAAKATSNNRSTQGSRVIRGLLIGLGVLMTGVILAYFIYRYKTSREY